MVSEIYRDLSALEKSSNSDPQKASSLNRGSAEKDPHGTYRPIQLRLLLICRFSHVKIISSDR